MERYMYCLQKRRSLFAIYFELYFQFIISGYEVEQYREGLFRERNREEEAYDKRDKEPNKVLALPPYHFKLSRLCSTGSHKSVFTYAPISSF